MPKPFTKIEGERIVTEPLLETFTKYNSQFNLLKRTSEKALYERTLSSGKIQYEVVRIYIDKDGKENLPGSSTWGMRGWTLLTKESAKEKYSEV